MARDARCTMGPRHPRNNRAIAPARDTGDCEAAEQCNSRSRPEAERERHEHGHERTPVEKPRPYRGHAANRNPARRKEKGPAPTPAARGPLSPTAPLTRRARLAYDHSTRRKGLLITPYALVTPHPRAITCAREPNRPALVESATISRSRSPAPVPQNVSRYLYRLAGSRPRAQSANGKSAQTATMPRHHRVERRNRSRGTTDGDGRCRQSRTDQTRTNVFL